MTVAAVFVHGYHPWAEDAALYLPGVEKLLNPQLFPLDAQFFETHAHVTFFPNLIAASVRVSHLPLAYALFVWHLLTIFLLLYACWELAGKVFVSRTSRYAGVALVAALLTLPVAGTALYLMDQYLNPRNLTAFVGVLAIAKLLDGRHVTAALLLVCAAAIHLLMAFFAISFCGLLLWMRRFERNAAIVCLLPFGFLASGSNAYHQAILTHAYFFPLRWHWYEWVGAIGPIAIFWWFSRCARGRQMWNLGLVSRTVVIYESIFVIAAVIISIPPRFESLGRLQFMRSLHLAYILLVLFSGGWLGEFVLKQRWWRCIAVFLPLCAGMFYAQRVLFPASAHIEWPWAQPRNSWTLAFDWVRENTPLTAIFALDPDYMHIPGEDENGFRPIAQRSMLADNVTDGGAVSMFPALAEEWLAQVQARNGWEKFQPQDFHRLQMTYGVSWVVLPEQAVADIRCPYGNRYVKVCRID